MFMRNVRQEFFARIQASYWGWMEYAAAELMGAEV
jgi:hypothetical protein